MSEQKAVTPLTPAEAQQVDASVPKDSWFHKDAVIVDKAIDGIVLGGNGDETISAHSARVEEETTHGFKHEVAHILNESLDVLENDHGSKAVEADKFRAEQIVKTEESSGLIPQA